MPYYDVSEIPVNGMGRFFEFVVLVGVCLGIPVKQDAGRCGVGYACDIIATHF